MCCLAVFLFLAFICPFSLKFILLVSPNGERNSLKIKQDIKLYQGTLGINENLKYKVENERHAWIQIAHGEMILDEQIHLEQGDGVAFSDGDILNFSSNNSQCQFLLFDLQIGRAHV